VLGADLGAALVQQFLNVAQCVSESGVEHHGQTDDLGARLGVPKGRGSWHNEKQANLPARPLVKFS
jgi:hypothetical protein